MKIRITYQDNIYDARVFNNYSALIVVDGEPIMLNQCRECGAWCSEDEELYGDGYCTGCAVMCEVCQQYFCKKDMSVFCDSSICKKCLKDKDK